MNTVKRCSWCDIELNGRVISPGEVGYADFRRAGEKPEMTYYQIGFCSDGCAWTWWIEQHGIMGVGNWSGQRHLITGHGLKPGTPAGEQSQVCFDHFARIAKRAMEIITDPDSGALFVK